MTTYTVQPGDSLSKISGYFYEGDQTLYPIIAAANYIIDADAIQVGQSLIIPDIPGYYYPSSDDAPTPAIGTGSGTATQATSTSSSTKSTTTAPATGINKIWYFVGAVILAGGAALAMKKLKKKKTLSGIHKKK